MIAPQPPAGLHPDEAPGRSRRAPRRDELPAATVRVLKAGGPTKADVLLVDVGEGPVVVKDFAGKGALGRLLGRLQVGREHRAYQWLRGMPGVPGLVGRIDPWALAIERVDGLQLDDVKRRFDEPAALLARLRAVIDAMHARGLVHLDLRGRENVLVTPAGELIVIDLAGAVWLRPGGLLHRLLFRTLALTDEAAYLNWKQRLLPGRYTADEEAFLRRFGRVRRLWVFNRKKPARTGR